MTYGVRRARPLRVRLFDEEEDTARYKRQGWDPRKTYEENMGYVGVLDRPDEKLEWPSPEAAPEGEDAAARMAHKLAAQGRGEDTDIAHVARGELSANYRLTRDWNVFASGNITESKITKNGSRPDTVGNKIPYAADYTINLGTQIKRPITSDIDAIGRLDYRVTGPTWFHAVQDQTRPTPNGPADLTNSKRKSFGLLNLRAGLSSDRWSLTAFANNLTAENWLAEVVPAPELGGSFVSPGSRRQFGLEASFRF